MLNTKSIAMKSLLEELNQFAVDTRQVYGGAYYRVTGRAKWYDESGTEGITITDDGCIIQWVKLDSTGEVKHCDAVC